MISIVNQLVVWTRKNAEALRQKGIQIVEKFPEKSTDPNWKASLGLTYDDISVSYTVWERTILQTELLVVNASTKQTIVMDEDTPNTPDIVDADLDVVVANLLSDTYKNMKPDPKLTVT